MMKQLWWKHPEMILLYGVLGAIAGVVLGTLLCSTVQNWATSLPAAAEGYQIAYSGISGIFLVAWKMIYNAVLGGITGCLLVHLRGKYRVTAIWTLIIFGSVAMFIVGSELESFARSYGWETALAVFGINCYWAFCLVVLGGYLLVVEIGSTRSDLQ